ncbi:hypothetical protein [Streptomyces sp. NPDC048411]|uniref:hypothetical protein n=1 Tax=Streptomyces sp. NPDC048411 TaxID=3157206 RepID=UPI00345521DA
MAFCRGRPGQPAGRLTDPDIDALPESAARHPYNDGYASVGTECWTDRPEGHI